MKWVLLVLFAEDWSTNIANYARAEKELEPELELQMESVLKLVEESVGIGSKAVKFLVEEPVEELLEKTVERPVE